MHDHPDTHPEMSHELFVKPYEVLFAVAPTNVEKKHTMHALGATPVMALKTRTLEWALRSEDVKLQVCARCLQRALCGACACAGDSV